MYGNTDEEIKLELEGLGFHPVDIHRMVQTKKKFLLPIDKVSLHLEERYIYSLTKTVPSQTKGGNPTTPKPKIWSHPAVL